MQAFEQAWLLLKAHFQPKEGKFLDAGQNQSVFVQEDNPDVMKVGDAGSTQNQLRDMYLLDSLSRLMPIFAGQQPVKQTADLPKSVQSRMPMLSTQERGVPFKPGPTHRADAIRGRQLVHALQEGLGGGAGQLLEYLGIADLKPPNWMKVPREGGVPEGTITGRPGPNKGVIHDPMFYGPTNEGMTAGEKMAATVARGAPRRHGEDYQVPSEIQEHLLQEMDAKPFDQFVNPLVESYHDINQAQLDPMMSHIKQQGQSLEDMLSSLGTKGL